MKKLKLTRVCEDGLDIWFAKRGFVIGFGCSESAAIRDFLAACSAVIVANDACKISKVG